jgi:thiol-disulfide isomerase/thioredoxin
MTPVQALVKNILAMGLIIYVFRFTEKANDKKDPFLISTLILGSILTIFLVGPLRQITTKVADDTEIVVEEVGEMDEPVNIDTLTVLPKTPADTLKKPKKAAPVVDEGPKKKKSGYKNWFADIDNGKKILCFFAPGCDHCKETAKELTQLKKEIADFPEIRIVFMDEEAELIPNFFEFAGAKYPYQIADVATFWQTMGTQRDTPGVFYLWNGNVIKEYDGINEKKFVKSDFKKIVTKK